MPTLNRISALLLPQIQLVPTNMDHKDYSWFHSPHVPNLIDTSNDSNFSLSLKPSCISSFWQLFVVGLRKKIMLWATDLLREEMNTILSQWTNIISSRTMHSNIDYSYWLHERNRLYLKNPPSASCLCLKRFGRMPWNACKQCLYLPYHISLSHCSWTDSKKPNLSYTSNGRNKKQK